MNTKYLDYASRHIRSIAKRCKNLTFSTGLVLMFVMLGVNAFSEEIVSKQEINVKADNLEEILKKIKSENDKKLKGVQLELVQLIEQGNQVVKSPWSSWQFGINYMYDKWSGTYNGRGDKKEKYPFEGIFTRGEWWKSSVSPTSKTYSRIVQGSDPISSLTSNRNGYQYGLVGTKKVPDNGVPFIIEPVININTPPLPSLNISPTVINREIKFTIPDVATVPFSPTILPDIRPNVFNPPALDQVATGFAQDMVGVSFYTEPNVIINNAKAVANTAGTTISIVDNGFTIDGAFTYTGQKDNQGTSTTQNRTGRVSQTDPLVEGIADGTWKFDESNPNPDNTGLTAAHKTSNVANSTVAYSGYNNAAGRTYRVGAASSPQTVFSFTQYQQSTDTKPGNTTAKGEVSGNWVLKNTTSDPIQRNKNYSNTVRFISVNGTHVYSFYDPTVVNLNGNVNIFGRSAFDTLTSRLYNGWTHMTVAVEQQAASARESIFTNNGVITLEKEAAKPAVNAADDAQGSFLIGFAAMIEDYGQYQPTSGNSVNSNLYSDITYRPWASEMNNKGTINVNSVESIGVDFSEFSFEPNAGMINGNPVNPMKSAAWGNKGSLRIYMNTGDINVTSTDPGNRSTVRGSYGIRVPNIFNGGRRGKTVDTEGIYYDETIIDGNGGTVTLTGSHNVGVSISKKIGGSGTTTDTYTETQKTITTGPYRGQTYTTGTGTMSVYNYQTGKGANDTGLGGAGTYLNGVYTTDVKSLNNTGRTANDLIGNIYNLNIVVDGKENVGFLRNYDYMYSGANGSYSAAAQALAQGDFNIKDSHVKSINFTLTTDGGTLFRTDRFGINLEKNLTGLEEVEPGNASTTDGRYNIVMLANGALNPNDTVLPKVKNTGNIIVRAGGQNVIGLMAYNGGAAEVAGDLTITNSSSSIGLVVSGANINRASSATSSGNIKVTGVGSAGVYNNAGTYEMTAGSIKADGAGTIAVYASAAGTTLANTKLGAGTVEATGTGAAALYASGGSDIELNGTTLNIGNGGLLFYGAGIPGDESQLYLTGNATANIGAGGIGFYVKSSSNSPLASIRKSGSTGILTLNMANGSTLIVAEGNGGNVGGELVSNLSNSSGGGATGIIINGTAGSYIPYKASRVHLTVDQNSNLDNPLDAYLKSEFSSSSITIGAGITVSGSGAITTPTTLAKKAKAAIAQKNTTTGVGRNDVILTNNGTINLTGKEMAGIVGEFAEIYNKNILNTTGDNSTAIIVSNGGIATNTASGKIKIGNGGVGIAGINYLGVTDSPSLSQPATGEGFIEIVHAGSIVSSGTKSAIGILALDKESNNNGTSITATQASKITLGLGSIIDVSSAEGGVGVYSKGVYRNGVSKILDNGADITINKNGIGIYSEGTKIEAFAGTIKSVNNTTAKGIYTDSDVTNSKNITLLGDKSIGIHNYGINPMYPSKLSMPRNYVEINNDGEIRLGDSADVNDPSIGIYTKYGSIVHQGKIIGGRNTLGIFSDVAQDINLNNGGSIKLNDGAIGIYKKQGSLELDTNSSVTVGNNATAVYADNGLTITNNSNNIEIGDNSFGFVIKETGNNTYTSNATSNFKMGTESVYLYKKGAGNISTATTVKVNGSRSTALFANSGAEISNSGKLDLRNGIGNVGAFALNATIKNTGNILTGKSDADNKYYSIGMAAQNNGVIINEVGGTIVVSENYGIGMFAEGVGSKAENKGTIKLESTGELKGAYGMYLNNGAYGLNEGTIISGRYSGDITKEGVYGIAVLNGATLENKGTIDIDANNSYGVYIKNGIIKNYGTIRISGTGSIGLKNKNGKDSSGKSLTEANLASAGITASNGAKAYSDETNGGTSNISTGNTQISTSGVVTIDGKVVPIHDMTPGPTPENKNYAFSNVGIYIDTLGKTKPIEWVDGYDPTIDNDLILGAEAAELSNSKAIKIGKDIMTPFIQPYLNSLTGMTAKDLNTISGSLTWTVQPIEGRSGMPEEAIMAKIPYTDFVDRTDNAWNFTDGLEQRYGVEALDSKEKRLFNKLNSIGKNEQVLLTQAYDEMMGHQYANVQQRIHSTGQILDKEFDYLKDEWRTASKDSNKVKVFGMKGEYSTDTAGIIDYKSNAYGVAYVGENETVKLGTSSGWYTGIVHNTFKFKDIGNSKEEMLQAKLGLYNTKAFDDNGSLAWTISGEGFVGYNKMHRKFLVVDEIFNAKSNYWSYGVALKNELSKSFRLSEDFTLRGYGSIKAEYGRFQKIKEKKGEVRLEVKANDYISIKPEIGAELIYKVPLTRKLLNVKLGVAYENELGKVAEVNNKARVAYTSADWFGIRSEKEDRRGNVKADLSLGLDNERYGITANIGYDTKGKNKRAGLGLRVIF